jgi:hypothetical protein
VTDNQRGGLPVGQRAIGRWKGVVTDGVFGHVLLSNVLKRMLSDGWRVGGKPVGGGTGSFARRHVGRVGRLGPAAAGTPALLMVQSADDGAQAAFPMNRLIQVAGGQSIG